MKMLLLSVVMLVICIADVRASTGCDLSNRVLNYIVAPRHFDVSSETVNLLRKDGISDMQISDILCHIGMSLPAIYFYQLSEIQKPKY